MKAFVFRTSQGPEDGKIVEAESLEKSCGELVEPTHFMGENHPYLIIWKPDFKYPVDKRELECDWVIEIYDDWRE